MSRLSGSKRKASSYMQGGYDETTACNGMQNTELDRELKELIEKVKDGSHPFMQGKVDALKKAKESKIAAADRHRQMMILNVNQLFEYEQEDANALFTTALSEVQDRLIEEISDDYNRMKQKREEAELMLTENAEQEAELTATGSSSSSTAVATTTAAAADQQTDATASTERLSSRQRALRSAAAAAGDNGTEVGGTEYGEQRSSGRVTRGSAESAVNGATTSRTTRNSNGRKAGGANGSKELTLDFALPESSMRADFVEIVRDLQSRAAQYEQSKPSVSDVQVRLSGDLSELYIGNTIFGMGDSVVVFSVHSQENICGVITGLSHKEIIVRTGSGTRFSVLVGQLRTGRVTVSKDEETVSNAHIFQAAAEMDSILAKYNRQLGVDT